MNINYQIFNRQQWANLRANVPLLLTSKDIASLSGFNDPVDLQDVEQIYLPLSRLLNLQFNSTQSLREAVEKQFFQRENITKTPYIIGIAGSVAVGKSTFSRILQRVLQQWNEHSKVDLLTTDGFLFSNSQLAKRNLMHRKGFPESYDVASMIATLQAVKAGKTGIKCPVYSHQAYDIQANQYQYINNPDILIVEGLNVLQAVPNVSSTTADYFDYSIYLDAKVQDIANWYVERFLQLQKTVFTDPQSFFHKFKDMTEQQAKIYASSVWQEINLPNLQYNIEPTKSRARMIVYKQANHKIAKILLRNF